MSRPPTEEHVHAHVERQRVVERETVPVVLAEPEYVAEERSWAGFLTARLL